MSHPQTEIAIENMRNRGERITGPNLSREVRRMDDATDRIYRLQLGPLTRQEAEAMLQRLRGAGYRQAFFVN